MKYKHKQTGEVVEAWRNYSQYVTGKGIYTYRQWNVRKLTTVQFLENDFHDNYELLEEGGQDD